MVARFAQNSAPERASSAALKAPCDSIYLPSQTNVSGIQAVVG